MLINTPRRKFHFQNKTKPKLAMQYGHGKRASYMTAMLVSLIRITVQRH